ncbi:MAG: DUF1003 domain-containing protein [Chloroflexota bacterium]|nr:DUF1003 domain-containing protein [Chloroflexota bacterium]
MGSWRFIAIQTGIVAIWLAANIVLLTRPFDPAGAAPTASAAANRTKSHRSPK